MVDSIDKAFNAYKTEIPNSVSETIVTLHLERLGMQTGNPRKCPDRHIQIN